MRVIEAYVLIKAYANILGVNVEQAIKIIEKETPPDIDNVVQEISKELFNYACEKEFLRNEIPINN